MEWVFSSSGCLAGAAICALRTDFSCLCLRLSAGLTKRDSQLNPTQKYLAIRYVAQVCLWCFGGAGGRSRSPLEWGETKGLVAVSDSPQYSSALYPGNRLYGCSVVTCSIGTPCPPPPAGLLEEEVVEKLCKKQDLSGQMLLWTGNRELTTIAATTNQLIR